MRQLMWSAWYLHSPTRSHATPTIIFLLVCRSSVHGESGKKDTHQKWTVLGPTGLFQNLAKPL